MVLIKKQAGAIALAKVLSDLTLKGYSCLLPVSDINRYDLVVDTGCRLFKIQVKYTTSGNVVNGTCYSTKKGVNKIKYNTGDFDYYAIYLATIDKVIYPSIAFKGSKIATTIPDSWVRFYWWEDFTKFTDSTNKRSIREFNKLPTNSRILPQPTKITWPSDVELTKLVWEKPLTILAKELGVSNTAIKNRCKRHNIQKPEQGFWTKKTTRSYGKQST